MASRLDEDLLNRFVDYAVRVLTVVEALDKEHRPRRLVDQLTGSGTSPGAQMFEANEALSRRDFAKLMGVAAKELSETRFWLLVLIRKQWIEEKRVAALLDETMQLLRIVKAMRVRTKRNDRGD